MSATLGAILVVATLVFIPCLNAWQINRRRDRARDEQVLERRRQRGGLI